MFGVCIETQIKLKRIIILLLILFAVLICITGCEVASNSDDVTISKTQDIELTTEDRKEITKKIETVAGYCKAIFLSSDRHEESNIVLDDEAVHKMIDEIGKHGQAVACGNNDYNMQNYELINEKLILAQEGKDTSVEFYTLNDSAIITLYNLEFTDKKLFVTTCSAKFDETANISIIFMEKIQPYEWQYTKKGWLIWEKEESPNQEMDMHVFTRILPLEGRCRELGEKYISPISYFCNNLFLTDWDMNNLDKIEFNDLFEFLYKIDTGNEIDSNKYKSGIPREEFEATIQKYFDISSEDLQKIAEYDEEKEVYFWSEIGYHNRVQQTQPFPEVVDYKENEDGTVNIYVDAVLKELGTDCSFSHLVTIRENSDGSWEYCGNTIDRENALVVPDYKPRREYEEIE